MSAEPKGELFKIFNAFLVCYWRDKLINYV